MSNIQTSISKYLEIGNLLIGNFGYWQLGFGSIGN